MVFSILPANTESAAYEIDNSLRFNDGDSSKLTKTFGSAGTSVRTFTISFWVKKCLNGKWNDICGVTDSSNNKLQFHFRNGDDLRINFFPGTGGDTSDFITNQLFRDPSAWYHIVLAMDTTQGTEANRKKLYVNGSQVTSFATQTFPSQNADTGWNSAAEHQVGYAAQSNNYADIYLADFNSVDGQALDPTYFGETNDNGVWIPKKYTGSYGDNGFFLEFQQTGTGTASASTIGADTSGNTNHFTSTNLAATDITVDTPTNNFCTLNPLADANLAGATFSEGNCKVDVGKSGVESGVISTFLLSSGKWYWESKMIDRQSASTFMIGVVASQVTGTGVISNYAGNKFYYSNNGDIHDTDASGDNGTDYGNTYDEGDIVGVALDLDNNKIYFSKNGTFQASGNPAGNSNGVAITAPASTNLGGYIAGFGGFQTYSHVIEINFGNAPFAISSGNADANGYGNFEYAVPSGFFACCTKNLAEYG